MAMLSFLSFCLGCYRKWAISLDWVNIFFWILLILAKRLNLNNLPNMLCSKNVCISLKKKGLCQALFGFTHISSVYNVFLNTTILCCGLKFILIDGGINSEHIDINNIMFNYSYHGILATEYEELKTKMQPLWA